MHNHMRSHRAKAIVAAVTAGIMTLSMAACGGAEGSKNAAKQSQTGGSLVVDNQFDIISLDPARSFETSAVMVHRAAYEQALQFKGTNYSKLYPGVCTYEISPDDKVVTLKLNGNHYFADGKKVTVDDIVYSYQRVQGVQGNPSFYLDGVTVAKKDNQSLTLTSETPNPAIPYILPSTNLSIVEKSVVEANGGKLSPDDTADSYLNKKSAGSGPYQFDSVAMDSKITLKRNPHYVGTKSPYDSVVINNVDATTQLTNIKAGTTDIATDINSDEAVKLTADEAHVSTGPSTTTDFLWFNADKQYGGIASNPDFVNAVRKAIHYDKYIKVYGAGSKQAYGVVPGNFLGGLESSKDNAYDLDEAKKLLAESGYNGEEIQFLYSSDGDESSQVAQLFQNDMKALGVTVKLVGQPTTTRLDTFRSGKFQAGLSSWGADYPDPSDYFVFTPDENISKRTGWYTTEGAKTSGGWNSSASADKIMPLVDKAKTATGTDDRAKAWRDLQDALNQDSPFIPIVIPGGNIVTAPSLKSVNRSFYNVDFQALR